ncbi:N-acetyl-alpha-D-glucosaminyl-diphospho-ditrans,octacis-undecaprenol 4-epimerase [compost metagenome]
MTQPQRVLITGATGFVGTSLVNKLSQTAEFELIALVRGESDGLPANVVRVRSMGAEPFAVKPHLFGVDIVVHLAARAHVLRDKSVDPLAEFRAINVDGTIDLARQAIDAGVKRFVFVSSIGVNGGQTLEAPFSEASPPAPHADYAVSKFEAEEALRELVEGTEMELVIVRPPLVYSGNAPGNFARLMKLVASGVPLPFASLDNRRSMIALDNLVEFIALCMVHPAAANELFLISDGEEVSTANIVRYLARGMNKTARLLPVPKFLVSAAASAVGKRAIYTQLYGSLVIDSSKARSQLGWAPSLTPENALTQAGRDYLRRTV